MSEHQHTTDTIEWLLEPENPSVRYLTMRHLLGRPADDPEVKAARAAIPQSRVADRIFARQTPEGHWGNVATPYLPKYKASYWTLMVLAQMGLSQDDDRVRRAVEYISRFQQPMGGFAATGEEGAEQEYELIARKRHAKGKRPRDKATFIADHLHQGTLSCLTGNVVAALLRLGYIEDARVWRAVAWLTSIQNTDGGWLCPYWGAHIRDTHSCFHGTICVLEALSEIPEDRRSPAVQQVIARAAEFLLIHRLYKADHHNFEIINATWLRLAFPWFASYSVLRGLWVLTRLGIDDPRMDDARSVLGQKQTPDERWILESTPYGRMQANLERKGQPSKWVTLKALQALR